MPDVSLTFLLGTHAHAPQRLERAASTSSHHLHFTKGPFVRSDTAGAIALSAKIGDDISSVPLKVIDCAKPAQSAAPRLSAQLLSPEFINRGEAGKNLKGEVLFKLTAGTLPGRIRLGLLPAAAPASVKWIESTDRPALAAGSTDTYKALFDFPEPAVGTTGVKFEDGIDLKIALLDLTQEVGAPAVTLLEPHAKYKAKP